MQLRLDGAAEDCLTGLVLVAAPPVVGSGCVSGAAQATETASSVEAPDRAQGQVPA